MTIEALYRIILSRRRRQPKDSYVAGLFSKGKDRIIQKVGEESIEVVIASKDSDRGRIISEFADLLFHSLILLVAVDIKPEEILEELERRRK